MTLPPHIRSVESEENHKICLARCQILRITFTKFDFGWASPQTPLGSIQRSPDPLARFKGPTSRGGEGNGKRQESE